MFFGSLVALFVALSLDAAVSVGGDDENRWSEAQPSDDGGGLADQDDDNDDQDDDILGTSSKTRITHPVVTATHRITDDVALSRACLDSLFRPPRSVRL